MPEAKSNTARPQLFELRSARRVARLLNGPRWFLCTCLLFVLFPGGIARAQESAEGRAFKSAALWFQNGVYDRAERALQQFVAAHPQSPMLAEAVLLQARSAMAQTNLARAVSILNSNLPRAGLITDQYRYRLGEAHLALGDFAGAAESFALVSRQFPNSGLVLEAAYGEAIARFKRREFARVVELLQDANGSFQQAVKIRASDRFATSGWLLLAEALFERREFAAAVAVLAPLGTRTGGPEYPELDWERQHLLCRVHIATGRLNEALGQSSNLVAAAAFAAGSGLPADSRALQAGVLRQLDRIDDAIAVYTNNLAAGIPEDRRRLAVLNVIELRLAQGRTAEAAQMLEDFVVRNSSPGSVDSVDLALLTAGELQLRLHFDPSAIAPTNLPPAAGTNRLQWALSQFDRIGTNSALRGKALLNRGWCLWIERRIPESAVAFRAAVEALPQSEDLAVARFKLADAHFAQSDFTNALAGYRAVTNDFAAVPRVRASLFDQALYQTVRAQIALGDVDAAVRGMTELIEMHPQSEFSERSLWLVGMELATAKEPSRARRVFTEFVGRFPGRPLTPRVELALAESHLQEGSFDDAVRAHTSWLERYGTNGLRVRAEYNLAWANARAGRVAEAMNLFTNLLGRFPTNELAREAQFWVADEHFRLEEFPQAQRGYQIIAESTNWVRSPLTSRARMMAGRAAFSAQLWKDASDHFAKLIEDAENCPVEILAEAYFALGDTITRETAVPRADATEVRPLKKFADAKTAFERLTQLPVFATNRVVAPLIPLAWGRIGDCCLQLAAEDPKQYENATNAYFQAMQHPAADVATRSLGEFGLAHVLEAQAMEKERTAESRAALLKLAFEHYFNLVLGGNLTGGARPDPAWVEKAGFAAARLAEAQSQWELAISVYRVMHEALEPLRPRLAEKIARAGTRLRGDGK